MSVKLVLVKAFCLVNVENKINRRTTFNCLNFNSFELALLLGETKLEPADVFFALVSKNQVDFAGCDCDCQPANSYIEVSLCFLQKKDNKL